MSQSCPVCLWPSYERSPFPGAGDATWCNCSRCGQFVLTGTAEAMLPTQIDLKANRRALMSHRLRRMYEAEKKPVWVNSFGSFWVDGCKQHCHFCLLGSVLVFIQTGAQD
jgi:hypothetical protein